MGRTTVWSPPRLVVVVTSGAIRNVRGKKTAEDIRDDFRVLPVVLCEWTCGTNRALVLRVWNIAPQERGVRNFHLVERQFVVEQADWDLEATMGPSVSQKTKADR
jgi:hypothetical protein